MTSFPTTGSNRPDRLRRSLMKTVFVLQHSYQLDDAVSSEETKLIGVYSSRLNAEQAVKRLRKKPGFKRLPKYFCIDEYALDQDNWAEGFITDRFIPIFSVWRKDQV